MIDHIERGGSNATSEQVKKEAKGQGCRPRISSSSAGALVAAINKNENVPFDPVSVASYVSSIASVNQSANQSLTNLESPAAVDGQDSNSSHDS